MKNEHFYVHILCIYTHIHTKIFYFSRFRPKEKVTIVKSEKVMIDSQMLSEVVESGRLNNAHVDSISCRFSLVN